MTTKMDLAQGLGFTLLIWSVASVIVGIILWVIPSPLLQGIGLMAILWGAIDLVIALFTLLKQKDSPAADLAKILYINMGLDTIYMVIGVLFIIFGLLDDFMIGSGVGIIIQGAFLFILDMYYYLRMRALIPDDIIEPPPV